MDLVLWKDVLRSIKRAVVKNGTIELCGQSYRVAYESRGALQDRDYEILQRLAENKQCVLDIGANKGHATLVMASKMATNGCIYAFEASESASLLIRENVCLNNIGSKVNIINTVVADRSGATIKFYWESSSGGASIIEGYLGHNNPLHKATLSIDDFVQETKVAPELIKIDVEGAESLVLAGMLDTLSRLQPIVFLELHSWEGTTASENAEQLASLLDTVNYQIVYLRTKQPLSDFSDLNKRGRCHVLLLDKQSPLPHWLMAFDTTSL